MSLVRPGPEQAGADGQPGPSLAATIADTLVGGYGDPRTYRCLGYAAAALPIGIVTFTAVVPVLAVGVSTFVLAIGLVVLAVSLVAARRLALAEIGLANQLLDARIEPPAQPPEPDTWLRQVIAELRSPTGWKATAWFALRLPLGIVALLAILLPLSIGLALIGTTFLGTLAGAGLIARTLGLTGGVAALLLWPHAVRAVGRLHAATARWLLGISAGHKLADARRRAAIAETRTDLARELHDSVGHSLTATLMQARAARRQIVADPTGAERALESIEQQNRLALEELDQVLAVLRDETAGERVVRGLADVPELVSGSRNAGQPVTLQQTGSLDRVAPGSSRVAYRVVQEALTNVARYAPGGATDVLTDVADGRVRVLVRNAAGGVVLGSRAGGGTGLIGLAERVERVGGTFSAGAAPGGGFVVEAELPAGRP